VCCRESGTQVFGDRSGTRSICGTLPSKLAPSWATLQVVSCAAARPRLPRTNGTWPRLLAWRVTPRWAADKEGVHTRFLSHRRAMMTIFGLCRTQAHGPMRMRAHPDTNSTTSTSWKDRRVMYEESAAARAVRGALILMFWLVESTS